MISSSSNQPAIDADALSGHVIVAGYGIPGRAVGELLKARKTQYCVIELNAAVVQRCEHVVPIIEGDVTDEQVLRRAGVERCSLLALTVPGDAAVLQAIQIARRMNPKVPIIARCRFISSGMEAHRKGANQVVIEEQVVADEFVRLLNLI